MPLAENTKDWLKQLAADGALSDEDLALLEEKLGGNEQVARRLAESVLRQNDYDRKMNEGKAQLQEKETATLNLQNELKAWKAEADRKITEANGNLDKERQAHQQLQERIKQARTKATELGIDPDQDLGLADLKETSPPPNTGEPKTQPKEQDGQYVSMEDFGKFSQDYLMLPALIADLVAEHESLFGKAPSNMGVLVTKAAQEKKPLREVWEAEYKVAEKRQEIAAEQQKQHDDQVRQEERERVLSELKNPVRFTPDSTPASPALGLFRPKDSEGKPKTDGVDAAVALWRKRQMEGAATT